MTLRRKIGLIISLAGFAITINTFPSMVTWFAIRFSVPSDSFGIVLLLQYVAFAGCTIITGKLHANKALPLLEILAVSLIIASTTIFFIGSISSFFGLALLMLIIGGCGGLVESIGSALLAEGSKNGNMLYSSQVFYAIGAFSAPLLIGICINAGIQVPVIGNVIGGLSLIIGFLVFILILSPQKDLDSSISIVSSQAENFSMISIPKKPHGFPWLFITMISYVTFESIISNWLPTFLQEAHGLGAGDASLMLTVFWFGLGTSRLAYVFFNKKGTKTPLILQSLFVFLAALILVFTNPSTPPIVSIIIVASIGIGVGPIWPLIVEHCHNTYKNDSLVMYIVVAGSLGGIIGPSLSSLFFKYGNITYLPTILVVYQLVGIIAVVVATQRKYL